MNTLIFSADRNTHVKIVVIALVISIFISILGIMADRANLKFVLLNKTTALRSDAFPASALIARQILKWSSALNK